MTSLLELKLAELKPHEPKTVLTPVLEMYNFGTKQGNSSIFGPKIRGL